MLIFYSEYLNDLRVASEDILSKARYGYRKDALQNQLNGLKHNPFDKWVVSEWVELDSCRSNNKQFCDLQKPVNQILSPLSTALTTYKQVVYFLISFKGALTSFASFGWCFEQGNSSFNLESFPLCTCKIWMLGNYQNLSRFFVTAQNEKSILWTRCLWRCSV